jgi:hypothetical protein
MMVGFDIDVDICGKDQLLSSIVYSIRCNEMEDYLILGFLQ